MMRVVEMDTAQAKDAETNGEQMEVKTFVFSKE